MSKEEEEEGLWIQSLLMPKSSLEWGVLEWVLNEKWVKKNLGSDPKNSLE